MAWPVEPWWAPLAVALRLLAAAGLAAALVAFLQPPRRSMRSLALLGAVATAALALLVARLDGAVLPAEFAWQAPWPHLADGLRFATFPLLLFASFLLFVWPAAKGRWHEAYVALAAGPGLGGLLVAAKVAFPRPPPTPHPFFGGPMGLPDDVAALALGLALLVPWLAWRLRPSASRIGWLLWLPAGFALGVLPLLTGDAWPMDTVAGWLLALAWVPLVLVGGAIARDVMAGVGLAGRVGGGLGRACDAVVRRGTAWLWGLVAVGVLLRLASLWWTPLGIDAYSYALMGQSFLKAGSFTMPWGDLHTFLADPVPSHHYPPLYPLLLAGFDRVLGTGAATVHVAGIATGLAALLVTYLCSRDLYGHRKALVATAAIAVSPLFVQNTGQGYSENLVLLLFVGTLWAILRSLERPAFMLVAGLLAGLGYLTKSSMGYFFVLAGLGGLAWRLWWKGWKVLRGPAYVGAIALFGSMVVAWGWRNWRLFGSWETSHHLSAAYALALGHPGTWLLLSLVTLVFYATLGYLVFLALLPMLPSLARSPKLSSEHDSGLWLALGLPLLLTAAIDAALWIAEGGFRLDNARYIGFLAVPMAWLLVRHARLDRRSVRVGAVLTFTLLLCGSLYFGKPTTSHSEDVGLDLAHRLAPTDSLGFVDLDNHYVDKVGQLVTGWGARSLSVQMACLTDPACPPEAKRPGELTTTWIVMDGASQDKLPASYAQVVGGPFAATPAKGAITLWHRASGA